MVSSPTPDRASAIEPDGHSKSERVPGPRSPLEPPFASPLPPRGSARPRAEATMDWRQLWRRFFGLA